MPVMQMKIGLVSSAAKISWREERGDGCVGYSASVPSPSVCTHIYTNYSLEFKFEISTLEYISILL